jgi:hypothetical protein
MSQEYNSLYAVAQRLREALLAEVVECALFAAPNTL